MVGLLSGLPHFQCLRTHQYSIISKSNWEILKSNGKERLENLIALGLNPDITQKSMDRFIWKMTIDCAMMMMMVMAMMMMMVMMMMILMQTLILTLILILILIPMMLMKHMILMIVYNI